MRTSKTCRSRVIDYNDYTLCTCKNSNVSIFFFIYFLWEGKALRLKCRINGSVRENGSYHMFNNVETLKMHFMQYYWISELCLYCSVFRGRIVFKVNPKLHCGPLIFFLEWKTNTIICRNIDFPNIRSWFVLGLRNSKKKHQQNYVFPQ